MQEGEKVYPRELFNAVHSVLVSRESVQGFPRYSPNTITRYQLVGTPACQPPVPLLSGSL